MALSRLSAALPFVTQFLALPPDTGLVIERRRVDPTGGVVASVMYQETVLTPDEGMYFGPEPASADPDPHPRSAIGKFGEGLYRTTIGDRHGHPNIVARLTEPAIPGTGESLVQWVLDQLQDSIAGGARFAPGQTVRVGRRAMDTDPAARA
ncbi:MAG: hypothetical protein J2P17_14640 [Mycobacterium sp.]|nr:hypothetical protein [Mycobacterium sp.]